MGKRICVNSNKVSVGVISLLSSLLGIRIRIFASRQCFSVQTMRARHNYAGAGEAHVARVMFAVGEAVWCL